MHREHPSDGASPPSSASLRALETEVARESVRSALFGRAMPREIGRYTIEQRLGRGAMGSVFAAHDTALDRRVALKLLVPWPPSDSGLERLEQRVLQEARAMARLRHASVVSVYEVGRHDAWVFIAMELLDGPSLRDWLRVQQPDWRRIVDVLVEIGDALAAAHDAGLAHGDIKPDNIRFDSSDRPRILDFGLARSMSASVGPIPVDPRASSGRMLLSTAVEGLGGTPAYAAPERLDGAAADDRSDQFAFFVTAYECIHGKRPFNGETLGELRKAIAAGVAETAWPGPRALRQAITRGLTDRPTLRFPSMDEAVAALRRLRSGRRRRFIAAGGVALLAGLAGYLLADRTAACPDAEELTEEIWGAHRPVLVDAAEQRGTPEAFVPIADHLDAYAVDWSRAQAEACRAFDREENPVVTAERLSCLRHHRAGFERLVARLGRDQAATWERARRIAVTLPSVASCDPGSPARPRPVPPRDDQIESIDAIGEGLAAAQIDAESGDTEAALARITELRVLAEAVGYGPLLAEARMAEGKVLDDLDRVAEASSMLRTAHGDALATGHTRVAANTAVALVYVDGYKLSRGELGHQWAWTARELLRGSDDAAGLMPSLVANEAALFFSEGRLAEADDGFAHAIELERARPQPDPIALDALRHNRGTVASQLHDHEGAARIHAEVLAERRLLFADDHRKIADGLVSLASAERTLGRFDDAVAHGEEALARLERKDGPESPSLFEALVSLAATYTELGRFDDAERAVRRVPTILRGHVDADHPDLANAHSHLAFLHLLRCDYEAALAEVPESIAMLERRGDRPLALAMARHQLADILVRLGRLEEARAVEEAALAQWADSDDPLPSSASRLGLAWIDVRAGQAERARQTFAAELALRERLAEEDTTLRAEALAGLGRSLAVLGRDAEAEAALSEALALYDEQRGQSQIASRMFVAQWLAEVLRRADSPADRDRARQLLHEAKDHWQRCGDLEAAATIEAELELELD